MEVLGVFAELLPDGRTIKVEAIADGLLRRLNFSVYVVGGNTNKTGREISKKHFKLQVFAYVLDSPQLVLF